jgi:hypothetical protein
MTFESCVVGDTVGSHFLSYRWHLSCFITTLGTYHGASVIIHTTFDWNLLRMSISELDAVPHNCIPYVHTGFRMAL